MTLLLLITIKAPAVSTKVLSNYVGSVMILSKSLRGGGTGFHVEAPSGDIYIMTNKHVCRLSYPVGNYRYVNISIGDKIYRRRVISMMRKADLCLVEPVYNSGLNRFDKLKTGDIAISIGFGGLNPASVKQGVFGSLHRVYICTMRSPLGCLEGKSIVADSYNLRVIGGDSGSPILSTTGKLVGVIFAGGPGGSFGVPIKHVLKFLEDR